MNRSRQSLVLGLVCYLLFLVFVVLAYRDYGVSWDEYYYLGAAKLYIAHFFEMGVIAEHVPDFHLQSHGGLVDALYFLPLQWLDQAASYDSLHLVKALSSSLILVLIYLILHRLEPDSLLPAAGVLLLIFFPSWLGNAFDNHMDGSATLLYALEMTMVLRVVGLQLDSGHSIRSSVFRMIGFAAVAAVSCSHRVSLLTVPAVYFLLLLEQVTDWARCRRLLFMAFVFAVAFYGVLFAVDPYVRANWMTGLFEKLYHSTSPGRVADLLVRFDGNVYLAANLPRSYLPTWILMSSPLLTLVLLGFGLVRLGLSLRPGAQEQRQVQAAFLLLTLFVPILAAVILHPVLFAAWRHFLFLSVPIAIIAALGLGHLVDVLPREWSRGVVAAFALGLAVIGWSMRELHPHQYLYINQMAGGLPGIDGRYETDYWARSYKEATEWVRARVEASGTAVASVHVCGPHRSADYYFSESMVLSDDVRTADYVICFTRKGFRRPQATPEHLIQRDGVTLTRIWGPDRADPLAIAKN